MSKEISIKLSDAQADALAEEANKAGLKYFDHCRAKLLAGLGQPVHNGRQQVDVREPRSKVLKSDADQRIDRLEAMMLDLGRAIQDIANPARGHDHGLPDAVADFADATPVDTDDMVSQALVDAERAGLTAVDRGPPQPAGGVRHVGTRRPSPFSVGSQPRHLAQAFGE